MYGFAAVGTDDFFKAVFIGVIMTATSVGITVQALREMGKLKGKVGTTILSAAIIDDVIGIIVLTFVIGFKNPDAHPFMVVINTVLFFVFAVVVGLLLYFLFKWLDNRFPHRRRLPIYAFAVCLEWLILQRLGSELQISPVRLLQESFSAIFVTQIISPENGHQFLYAVQPYFLCRYRIKNAV